MFLTTSDLRRPGRQYAALVNSKIVLSDGQTLAQLMIDFDIGVHSLATYKLKRVDADSSEE